MLSRIQIVFLLAISLSLIPVQAGNGPASKSTAGGWIKVSADHKHFVFVGSDQLFIPWGFNYDHDAANHLLEFYWRGEWDRVVEDFQEMKDLGANTVRIHLQVSRMMKSPTEANTENLTILSRLLGLAESKGLHLDVTGLGCYDKADVPAWYSSLAEQKRWQVQARFWEVVAEVCKDSPAVFCYDLMNEPVVTEGKVEKDWVTGGIGNLYYVQRINLDPAHRSQREIANAWVDKMVEAVRKHDQRHLITVGVIPWAMRFPGAKPIFYSPKVDKDLDFVSVHFYPKSKEVEKAITALAVYDVGKPIVIEETFPLSCTVEELDSFIDQTRTIATGWIGFYWGKTIAEYQRQSKRDLGEEITLQWLEYFKRKAPIISNSDDAEK